VAARRQFELFGDSASKQAEPFRTLEALARPRLESMVNSARRSALEDGEEGNPMRVRAFKGFDFRTLVLLFGAAIALDTVACARNPQQQETQPGQANPGGYKPLRQEYEVSMPETVESDANAPSNEATESPPEPEKPVRRVQPMFNNASQIATIIGEYGAVMKLDNAAALRVPEGALTDGKKLRFALGTLALDKDAPPKVGQSFALEPNLKSAGLPFELVVLLPAGTTSAELIVVVPPDPKNKGAKKPEYRRIPPKSVDAKKREALFELAELPGSEVYLTPKTEAAAAGTTAPKEAPATPKPSGADTAPKKITL
jgi:hypothetical protein